MSQEIIPGLDERFLRQGSQLLIISSGEMFMNGLKDMISHMTRKKGNRGAMLSTLWSANALSRRLSLTKLPKGSLKVIDTVSLSLGSGIADKEDFTFLSSPVPLESILVEVEKMLRVKGSDINFFIIDSLSFLKRYYTNGQMGEFFHYFLNRMLEEEITVIIFEQERSPEDPTRNLLQTLMDRTIVTEQGGEAE